MANAKTQQRRRALFIYIAMTDAPKTTDEIKADNGFAVAADLKHFESIGYVTRDDAGRWVRTSKTQQQGEAK